MGTVLSAECEELVEEYSEMANSKLHRMARKHFKRFKRPLGFLHCSVVDTNNLEAFARAGNAFGKNFGGQELSFRNLGAYDIAPPPETIWAEDVMAGTDEDTDDILSLDFEDESAQESLAGNPMMPWYVFS